MKYWTVFRNSKAGLLGKIGNILEIMKNVGVNRPAFLTKLTGSVSWQLWKGLWDLKMILIAYIFTFIFISKLGSYFLKIFLCVA